MMTRASAQLRARFGRRAIGPIGTVGRIVGGVALIAAAIAWQGIGWWEAAGGLLAFPLLAVGVDAAVTAMLARSGSADRHRQSSRDRLLINATVLVVVLAATTALTFITPIDAGAIWLFFGASMLLAAARGDGGCEVLAVANARAGHRDRIGCIAYGPLDALEARIRTRQATP